MFQLFFKTLSSFALPVRQILLFLCEFIYREFCNTFYMKTAYNFIFNKGKLYKIYSMFIIPWERVKRCWKLMILSISETERILAAFLSFKMIELLPKFLLMILHIIWVNFGSISPYKMKIWYQNYLKMNINSFPDFERAMVIHQALILNSLLRKWVLLSGHVQ